MVVFKKDNERSRREIFTSRKQFTVSVNQKQERAGEGSYNQNQTCIGL